MASAPPDRSGPPAEPGTGTTLHASCIAIGHRGVLIRGASGAGKSTLALKLILDAPRALPCAELVADDRVLLTHGDGGLLARPAPRLAGLIEVRGLGIRRLPYRPQVALTHVVDLTGGRTGARLPERADREATLHGHALRRIAAGDSDAAALLLAALLGTEDYEN